LRVRQTKNDLIAETGEPRDKYGMLYFKQVLKSKRVECGANMVGYKT
jgi:hypothetical protein